MKLLITSDLHGDFDRTSKVFEIYDKLGCDRILILGDLLYHGPRNDLPSGYDPKKVIELLNSRKKDILAVRGNCDTEVDQMVLDFPILADYIYLNINGLNIFATHGHKFNLTSLPPLRPGEMLLHGHTHLYAIEKFGDDNLYLNPGSPSIPKGGNPPTVMILDGNRLELYSLDLELINSCEI